MARAFCFLVILLTLGTRLLMAQGTGSSPRGTLFGSASGGAARNGFDLTAALSEAYESQPPPELRSRVQQGTSLSGGSSSMFVGSGNYDRTRRSGRIAATGTTAFRYYERLDRLTAVSHSLRAGTTLKMAGNSTLEANQTADYSPSYLYRLFPSVTVPDLGDGPSPAAEYRLEETRSFSYFSRATWGLGTPRGNRVTVTAERSRTDFHGGVARPDLDTLAGRTKFSHGVGRTGLLFAEHEYRNGEFGFAASATEHRLRVGGEYSPALSVSRRVHLRFSVSPSVLQIPDSATRVVATGALYRLEGDAAAEYPLLRTWRVGGTYRRGVEYIAVFREPVFRDATKVEATGLAGRRVDLSMSAGYVLGQSALQRSNSYFDTYTGTVRVRYSVSRSVAAYAEYLYYYYNLHGQGALAPDLPGAFKQQGGQVGLMLWSRPLKR
jgi:hypothetical protein